MTALIATIGSMAKKKTTDRHSSSMSTKTLRLRQDMQDQLDKLVEYTGTDESAEIRTAIRERLEKFNLWPPKQEDKSE